MKAVIQRVKHASVAVKGKHIAKIDQGILVLLGVGHNDTECSADKLLKKILNYRIFSDDAGKMNLSVQQVKGSVLIVSQFTIQAETDKGLRPGFTSAARPAHAEALYEYFIEQAKNAYHAEKIQTGEFAADMQVSLQNDGPITFILAVDEA